MRKFIIILFILPMTCHVSCQSLNEKKDSQTSFGAVPGQGGWLDSMTIAVNGNNYTDIHSILISKDGKLVYDKYFNGWTKDSIHDSHSAFKSITSILTGITIDKGLIRYIIPAFEQE